MSNYITVEREAFERLCSLIRESHSVSEGINDQNAATNSTYSSTKIEEMLNDIIAEANTAVSEVDEKAEEALAIAKGKNRAHIFLTTEAMQAALSDEVNKDSYSVGDNLYIVDTEVPDWWIVEVLDQPDPDTGYYYKVAQLETQKVDLTDIIESIELANEEIEKLNEEAATHVPNTRAIAGIDLTEDIVADELRDNLPDFTSTSDSYMPNSKAGGLEIKRIAGGVKQTRYDGKQLIPYPYYYGDGENYLSSAGIEYIVDKADYSLLANGTATSNANMYLTDWRSNFLLTAGTYFLSGGVSDSIRVVAMSFDDDQGTNGVIVAYDTGSGVSFTLDSDKYMRIYAQVLPAAGTITNVRIKPMLQLGSEATEYEPWVGGTPSPNPMYPQEIKNVNITEIKSEGKNLYNRNLDVGNTLCGVTSVILNNLVKLNGTATVNGIPYNTPVLQELDAKVGDIFTLSAKIISGYASTASNTAIVYLIFRDTDGRQLRNANSICTDAKTIDVNTKLSTNEVVIDEGVIGSDGKVRITINTYMRTGDVYNDLVIATQLEKGSEATEYEPYKSSIAKVAFTGRAIEVPESYDYTYEKDGKYYVSDTIEKTEDGYHMVQRIGECIFDGVKNMIQGVNTLDNPYGISFFSNINEIIDNAVDFSGSFATDLISTHFTSKVAGYNTGGTTDLGNVIYRTKTNVWFSIQRSMVEAMGIADNPPLYLQNFLHANPIPVQYILARPIVTPLSNEDAIAIMSLKTFNEVTYISTDSKVETLIDMNYGVSEAGARILKADNTALSAEQLSDFVSTHDSYMHNSNTGGLSIERIAGVVKQDKYEGKQLIPYPYSNMTRFEADGITLTVYEDGTILAKGTCTATTEYASFYIQESSLTNGETYTFSDESLPNTDAYTRLLAYKDDEWVQDISDPSENSTTFVYDETVMDTVSLFLRVNSGATVNMVFKPMLQLGSEVTEWEPYVGGVPSPNPMYPQEIQNVDITEIKTVGKNLLTYPYLNGSKTQSGIYWTDIGDGTIKASGTNELTGQNIFHCRTRLETEAPLILKPGTYTVSGCPSGGSISTYYIQVGKTLNGAWCTLGIDYGEGATFTITEDTQIQIQPVIAAGVMTVNVSNVGFIVFKPMLQLGSKVTEYEPYKTSVITTSSIKFRAVEVSTLDNYTYEKDGKYYVADTVEKTVDGYQLVQRIGEIVYGVDTAHRIQYAGIVTEKDGSELTVLTGTFDGISSSIEHVRLSCNCVCDKFSADTEVKAYSVYIYHNRVMFYLPKSVGITDVYSAQEWVQANPITLHYVLPEPIITPISDSDAIALLSLKTFDEATHISTNSAADALIDTKYGVTEVGAMTLNADNTALRAELRTKMLEAAMVNNI